MSKLIKKLYEEFGIPDVGAPSSGMNSVEAVNTKIERAEKTEEVDTVTFGLETDDNRIVKVYVKAEQANDFEEALSKELGVEDVIEDVLNKLSKDFDIIDVEWPDAVNDNDNNDQDEDSDYDEISVDDVNIDDDDNGVEQEDGSESLNQKAWGNTASGRTKTKHIIKKESDMTYGQLFTKKLLGEATIKSLADVVKNLDKDVKSFLKTGEMSDELYSRAYECYLNSGEMPIGIAKARTGDPIEWVADQLVDDLKSMTESQLNELAKTEEDPSKVITGIKHKVGLLDSRFSTTYQFMIYQALLDLGIPDEALDKAAQKSVIVNAIKNTAKELQSDPVRRQALKFLVNRLKEVPTNESTFNVLYKTKDMGKAAGGTSIVITAKDRDDANRKLLKKMKAKNKTVTFSNIVLAEAKKEDMTDHHVDVDTGEKVSKAEKEKADKMKVGQLDSRFSTVTQKLIYQTILMLGLPDSFLFKSGYKNKIVNSIKTKAKEFQKESIKRSSLRIFTHRFELANESVEPIVESVGNDTVEFLQTFMSAIINKDQADIFTNLTKTSAWNQFTRAVISNPDLNSLISAVRSQLGTVATKMAQTGTANPFSEGKVIGEFYAEYDEDSKTWCVFNSESPKALATYSNEHEAKEHAEELNRALKESSNSRKQLMKEALLKINESALMDILINAWKGNKHWKESDIQGWTEFGKLLGCDINEALSHGDDLSLDDPEDKEVDPDTKVKVKLSRKKDTKRPGDEATWDISKNKKTGELVIKTKGLVITLDDEASEKLMKAISNKSIAVLPDAELNGVKFVFSPRARTYMVKKAGDKAAGNPLILSLDDVTKIEDVLLGK